jgi:ABC-type transporter Mla subunit MlaD
MNLMPQIEAALEKAQEVINDQYVTMHELQLQVSSTLEGIRILNERVEEYDKRIEGVQGSTEQFFAEVQAENNRRNTIICQAFDSMQERISAEISTKLEAPLSPVSAPFTSPNANVGSPHIGFPVALPNSASPNPGTSAITTVITQVEAQGKLISDIHLQLGQLQTDLVSFNHHANVTLPNRVQQYCNDVSSRLHTYQRDQLSLSDQANRTEANLGNTTLGLQRHTTNTENNFKETAMHMDAVKKRFAEHRRHLDNLITAWQETLTTIDQLNGKYDSLKEFLSAKIVPTFTKIHKALPEILEANNPSNGTAINKTAEVENPKTQASAPQPDERRPPQEGDGGGGANDPIEL